MELYRNNIKWGSADTEQRTGALVSYDQQAHPGIIRIPVDVGDLWSIANDTRNSLFHDLPSDWTSIRLKIASFNPIMYYQQAGLYAYQNDDNYVMLTAYLTEITVSRSQMKQRVLQV
jgi:hypothetical protein